MLNSFLAAVLLAGTGFAQDLVPAQFRNFSGGLNDSTAEIMLPAEDSPDLLNVVIDEPAGSIKPRNGFTACGNTPSGSVATALYPYVKSNGSSRLIVSDSINLWQTSDCITFTRFRDNLSATARASFVVARDKLWVATRSTIPFTWDGSSTTVLDGGTNGGYPTPNPPPPACSYLEYWLDRVWCARTDSEPSAVYFSALTNSTGDILDPSTGTASWPATNAIYVDREGGSPIYGIKAYRGNLYVFKNNGIWRIVFRNDFDIQVVKTLSSVGTRFHTAIPEIDGLLYFVSSDGIYAFDGDQSVRISDKINTKFGILRQPQVNELTRIWTAAGDFDDGTFNGTTEKAISGSIVLSSHVFQDEFATGDGDFTNNPTWTAITGTWQVGTGGGAYPNNRLYSDDAAASIRVGSSISTGSWTWTVYNPGGTGRYYFKFISDGTDFTSSNGYALKYESNALNTLSMYTIERYPGAVLVSSGTEAGSNTGDQTYVITRSLAGHIAFSHNGTTYAANTDTTHNTSSNIILKQETASFGFKTFYAYGYQSSGTWTSEIYNATTVSAWGALAANAVTSGGTIGYAGRFGSSDSEVNNAAFVTITPGSAISTTTFARAQLRVTLNRPADDVTISPRLDDASISYQQGGVSSQTVHGIGWKNRLWLAASTGTINNLVLVKSKLPLNSWVPYDLQVGPMVKWNDLFYAAASTHSAIYRLDYGTNDNGAAFPWYWTSRSETWGRPDLRKTLYELGADFKRGTASSVKLGHSRDFGSTWTERTINMAGSGFGSTRQFLAVTNSPEYRFRIYDSTKDDVATITGVTGWARPIPLRQ